MDVTRLGLRNGQGHTIARKIDFKDTVWRSDKEKINIPPTFVALIFILSDLAWLTSTFPAVTFISVTDCAVIGEVIADTANWYLQTLPNMEYLYFS
jgi:hypothetical protein